MTRSITKALLVCFASSATACAVGEDLGEQSAAITAANFSFNALQFTQHQSARTSTVVSAQSDAFTLEAWVRWDGGSNPAGQAIAYNGNSSTSGYGLYAGANGSVSVLLGGVGWVGCPACRLSAGVWSHIAVR
jgi:hypothetical protein